MATLLLEPTNLCNRQCRHCMRNKADPPESMPLELAREILQQAKALGIANVSLTGGEVALYPYLEDLLTLIADMSFKFDFITNGFRFRERLLPLITNNSRVRRSFKKVDFSLDGFGPESHDRLRGEGSFEEVQNAVGCCKDRGLPFAFKTVVTTLNQGELIGLALDGARLGAQNHRFSCLFPTPALIREGLIPSAPIVERAMQDVEGWAKSIRGNLSVNKLPAGALGLAPCSIRRDLTVDHLGNLIFCCDLSHCTAGDGKPTTFGEEFLADLKEVPLREGIKRHFRLAAKLMAARLDDMENFSWLTQRTCFWCLKYFGKFDWLKDFPDSPWAAGVWPGETGEAKESPHNLRRTG
jgi:MoaA/NifB/PqqE/SkfB family radical SAM enzyme